MTTLADLLIEVDVDADRVAVRVSKAAEQVDRSFDRMAERAERSGAHLSKTLGDSGDEGGRGFGRSLLSGLGDSLDGGALDGLGGRLVGTLSGSLSLSAKTLATGFSAQFTGSVVAGLASGAVKVARGAAAIGALLPAAALAGVVAFGTLKLAVAGVGDALTAGLAGDTEAFEASLAGLSPAARGFAREVAGLKDGVDALRGAVQEEFFAPFAGQAERLGNVFLPILRRELGGVAHSFGAAVDEAAGFLATPAAVRAIDTALVNAGSAIGNMTGALADLVRAFLPLVTVGASFLPGLTSGFGDAAARVADFMVEAERTGQLRSFISDGLSAIGELADTAGRLWNVFKDVAAIFGMLGGFGGLFSGLGIEAGGLLEQLEELTGRARAFFETSEGGKAMADIVRTIRGLLHASMGMFAKIAGIVAPFAPQIAEFATAIQNLLTGIVDAARPVIEVFLGTVLPALTRLVNYVTNNGPLLQGILVSLFTLWALNAGIAAAATLVAIGPIILVGAAIAALAALVIVHFDTIKRWISNVWNWVKDNWPLLLGILTGPFGLAVMFIVDHWNQVVSFLGGLPGRIASAVAGIWDGIKGGLDSIVSWVWRQIRSLIEAYNSIPIVPDVGVPGGSRGFGRIARSHSGEMLPGGPGTEHLRILQGGEEVLARNDPRNAANIPTPDGIRALGRSGGAAGITVNNYNAGSILAERDVIRIVQDAIDRSDLRVRPA